MPSDARRAALRALLVSALMLRAAAADAHPAPFSYLDLHLDSSSVTGTLVVHDFDAAHDLDVASPDALLDAGTAQQ
jgi:hypothetical protein